MVRLLQVLMLWVTLLSGVCMADAPQKSATAETQVVIAIKVNLPDGEGKFVDHWVTGHEASGGMMRATHVPTQRTWGFSPVVRDEVSGIVAVKVFEITEMAPDAKKIKAVDLHEIKIGQIVTTATTPPFQIQVDKVVRVSDPKEVLEMAKKGSGSKCSGPAKASSGSKQGVEETQTGSCCVFCGDWRTCNCCVMDCYSCCTWPCFCSECH